MKEIFILAIVFLVAAVIFWLLLEIKWRDEVIKLYQTEELRKHHEHPERLSVIGQKTDWRR